MSRFTIISLGAGVQSSTMSLMAAKGEIEPMPDCAIFADTKWEPKEVYHWLEWLEKELPFPVYRVTAGDIRSDQMKARVRGRQSEGNRAASIPMFTKGETGKVGMVRRQCTREYKIDPIEKFIRRDVLHLNKGQRVPKNVHVEQWRGISTDEVSRMKPSNHKWMTVRYPLAMDLQMSRQDCKAWMRNNGYKEPPRSACIGCPFHSNYEWRRLRDNSPEEWADAVAFDKAIRNNNAVDGMKARLYLHRSGEPLDEADLGDNQEPDLFGNECEGMCGV